jgi:hypothetical protein
LIWLVASLLLVAVAAYLIWPLVRGQKGGEVAEREPVSRSEPLEPEPDDEGDVVAPSGPAARGKAGGEDMLIEKKIAELRRELKEARFCSRCGTRTFPGDSYCSHCGALVKGGKA